MQINLEATKDYASRENAIKAVEKKGMHNLVDSKGFAIRWFIAVGENGRFFPTFIGEAAIQAGIHFHFNVVG